MLDENRSPQTFVLAPRDALRAQAEGFQTGQKIAFRYIWEPDYDPGAFRYVVVDFHNSINLIPVFR